MKSSLVVAIALLSATAAAGAQGTKTPAKPDTTKKAATSTVKAPIVAPGTKQAAPPAANTKQPVTTKTAGTKAPDTKQAAPAPAAPAPAPQSAVVTPTIMREVYAYAAEGRRDPFVSLLTSSDLRPTVADLKLTSILYDENGSNSIAMMRDVTDNKQYRVVTGQTLGRMKVALIKRRAVIFSIEEFGLNRQDSLVLGDTTKARAK